MNTRNTRLAAIAIIITSLVLAIAIVKTKAKKVPPKVQERTWWVETISAKPGSYSAKLSLFAQIESPGYFSFYSPMVSQISELRVRAGDFVKKGDMLAKLDPADFKPSLDKAKSRVNQIEAKIQLEKLQYQQDQNNLVYENELVSLKQASLARQKKIHKKNLSSTSTLEEITQQLIAQQISVSKLEHKINSFSKNIFSLQSQLKEAHSDLEQAELAFKRSELIAPEDARIARVNIAVGDQVNSNQSLLSLYKANDLEIKAKLPLKYKDIFSRGLSDNNIKADNNIQATFQHSNKTYPVKLIRLGAESQAISVDVYFVLSDVSQGTTFNIGEVGQLKIALPPTENVIPVPVEAIYGQNTIYRLKDDRLQALSVDIVGDAYASALKAHVLVMPLDKEETIKNSDLIVTTHLPNAITGLKVKQHKDSSIK
ncbi:MAG: biotin/lipoyl-binding protein [Gammaproteobacteria bacterium]|nr:biotin/lipoyl-binding protein [Gammaproteobacteria bacterium]